MSTTTTTTAPVLEPAAQAFAEATAMPPFLSDLPPSEGRALLDEVQSGEIAKPDVDEEWITIAGGPTGEVKVRIVKPRGATGTLPVVLYIHGAGWVFGDAHTHDRLVRELAVGNRRRRPLPGRHPRLRDAQRPARDPRRRCGDPPGDRVPQPDPRNELKDADPSSSSHASNATRRLT